MRPKLATGLSLIALFFVCLLAPQEAQARRGGFVLITHGESVSHVEEVPEAKKELVREVTGTDVRVGYVYESFGLFWLDAWTWDGEFCLYGHDDVWMLSEQDAQELLGKSLADLDKPLLYRFPPLLMLAVLGGLIYAGFKLQKRRQLAGRSALLVDPTYRQATEIFANADADGFEQALTFLESQGLDRSDAYDDLTYVLRRRGLA